MARNQLPEGVGKKIVEALKRQEPEQEINNTPETEFPETEENDILDSTLDVAYDEENNGEDIVEDNAAVESLGFDEQETDEKVSFDAGFSDNNESEKEEQKEVFTFGSESAKAPQFLPFEPEPEQSESSFQSTEDSQIELKEISGLQEPETVAVAGSSIRVPYNVAILNNLVASLPQGVSKQTGAQIIRQTLEATGMSMRKVLKEAQGLQEQLNGSTRECMAKIQEYKSEIMHLEQSVKEYQKTVAQVNELVSLFLLTNKK